MVAHGSLLSRGRRVTGRGAANNDHGLRVRGRARDPAISRESAMFMISTIREAGEVVEEDPLGRDRLPDPWVAECLHLLGALPVIGRRQIAAEPGVAAQLGGARAQ